MKYLKFYYWSCLLHIWWLLKEPEGVYTLPRVALKRAFVAALLLVFAVLGIRPRVAVMCRCSIQLQVEISLR